MVYSALEASVAPALAVAGLLLVTLPFLSRDDNRARAFVFTLSVVLGWRYVAWRFAETVPAFALEPEALCAWAFAGLEAVTMLGASVASLIMSRTLHRGPEADAHVGWWRDAPPQVDVLIATYNEERAILERTIAGALGIEHPRLRIWILDDGRRDWLRDLCAASGVGYRTRPDNDHAKAGNINAGLAYLDGLEVPPDFVVVLDADFVPYRDFVRRTLALFHDPEVGLVQTPQHFFNRDPIQANLRIGDAYPDEQRFFFDDLMACRDAWGIAFCCGTSSMIRWQGLRKIGGFPTTSVTEDFLVTLKLKQHGWRTVYLNERLSDGLAPEGLAEYVTQRGRWCLGLMQIVRGPLGPFSRSAIAPMDRLSLIDAMLYWMATYHFKLACLIVPCLYWWFGISAVDATVPDVIAYFVPFFIAVMTAMNWISRGKMIPLLHDVSQLLTLFELNRAVWTGLLRPDGQKFKVTAKGGNRGERVVQWGMLYRFGALFALTLGGILLSMLSDYAPDGGADDGKAVVLFWTFWNLVMLAMAMAVCVELPRHRRDERYHTDEEVVLEIAGDLVPARLLDLSVGGACIRGGTELADGAALTVEIVGVGRIPAVVRRVDGDSWSVGFEPEPVLRDRLVRKMHSSRYRVGTQRISLRRILGGLGLRAAQ